RPSTFTIGGSGTGVMLIVTTATSVKCGVVTRYVKLTGAVELGRGRNVIEPSLPKRNSLAGGAMTATNDTVGDSPTGNRSLMRTFLLSNVSSLTVRVSFTAPARIFTVSL